jgi:hypothetical protein
MFNQPQDNKNSQQSQESSPFFSLDQPVFSQEEQVEQKIENKELFGLTSMQRFIIMLLIFVLTCVMGSLCLLLSGKIVL